MGVGECTPGSQTLQGFLVYLYNDGGTIKHAIDNMAWSTATGNHSSKITGAVATLSITPSVGAGTDFTAGAGLHTDNSLILNTAAQTDADMLVIAAVIYNDTGTDVNVLPQHLSSDVNGTTANRLNIALNNPTTAAAVGITTGNIGAGKAIVLHVLGWLA